MIITPNKHPSYISTFVDGKISTVQINVGEPPKNSNCGYDFLRKEGSFAFGVLEQDSKQRVFRATLTTPYYFFSDSKSKGGSSFLRHEDLIVSNQNHPKNRKAKEQPQLEDECIQFLRSYPGYEGFYKKIIQADLEGVNEFLETLENSDLKWFGRYFTFMNLIFGSKKIQNWILLYGKDFHILMDLFFSYYDELSPFLDKEARVKWEEVLENHKFLISFVVDEVAAKHSAQSFFKHTRIPISQLSIDTDEIEVNHEEIDEIVNKYGINKELLSDEVVDRLYGYLEKYRINFCDDFGFVIAANERTIHEDGLADELIEADGMLDLFLPYRAMKLNVLPTQQSELTKEKLGIIPTRPVIIVSSPRNGHEDLLLKVYRKEFSHLPIEERPVMIIGMRDRNSRFEYLSKKMKINSSIRDKQDQENEQLWTAGGDVVTEKDVVFLATMGELASLYSVADIALVDYNRNLIEPATYGVPILYFNDGRWGINEVAKYVLESEGGIKPIEKKSLGEQIREQLTQKRKKHSKKLRKAIHKIDQDILPDSIEFAELYLALVIIRLEKEKKRILKEIEKIKREGWDS